MHELLIPKIAIIKIDITDNPDLFFEEWIAVQKHAWGIQRLPDVGIGRQLFVRIAYQSTD